MHRITLTAVLAAILSVSSAYSQDTPSPAIDPNAPAVEEMAPAIDLNNPPGADEFLQRIQPAIQAAVQAAIVATANPTITTQVMPDGTPGVAANLTQLAADSKKSFAQRHPYITWGSVTAGVAGLAYLAYDNGWVGGGDNGNTTIVINGDRNVVGNGNGYTSTDSTDNNASE